MVKVSNPTGSIRTWNAPEEPVLLKPGAEVRRRIAFVPADGQALPREGLALGLEVNVEVEPENEAAAPQLYRAHLSVPFKPTSARPDPGSTPGP